MYVHMCVCLRAGSYFEQGRVHSKNSKILKIFSQHCVMVIK